MQKTLALPVAMLVVLGASVMAQASTTVYTSPEALVAKWYNVGIEKTLADKYSIGANAEFFQNASWLVTDGNLNLRWYVKSNDGGAFLQGTVMELVQHPKPTGANILSTEVQLGAGYKWVDESGITGDVRLWTPTKNAHAYVSFGIGYTW